MFFSDQKKNFFFARARAQKRACNFLTIRMKRLTPLMGVSWMLDRVKVPSLIFKHFFSGFLGELFKEGVISGTLSTLRIWKNYALGAKTGAARGRPRTNKQTQNNRFAAAVTAKRISLWGALEWVSV